MGDGLVWKAAQFKGSDVWARVESDDSTKPYVSESTGKACVKYKNTPAAKWYWCTADLVVIATGLEVGDDDGAGRRRSKRRRGGEITEEEKKAEEEEKKKPRVAENGKLYGVTSSTTSRKQFVRGKDYKTQCPTCKIALDSVPILGFIEATRNKTVRRYYGDGPSGDWKGSFQFRDRQFFDLRCWKVPKSAQQSLRGFIDIAGYATLAEEVKAEVRERLPFVADDAEDSP